MKDKNAEQNNSPKKVLMVGSSKLPIPAVKGGAVPNLIEGIISANEYNKRMDITCICCYDELAETESKKYKFTQFLWIKTPSLIKKIDKMLYLFSKKILHMNRLLSLSYFFQIIWFTLSVSKYLKNNNYDYVVFENSIPALHSLRLHGNAKKYKDKYFLHIHTVPRHYYKNKKIIKNCNKIICISEYVKNEIIKATKIDNDKFVILYNSIDTKLFKPLDSDHILEFKEKHKIPLNKKIILFAGRICKDKGVDKLIEAYNIVNNDNMLLLIVGSNFYKTSITSDFEKELIDKTNDIKDNIIFTGYMDYKDMPLVYNCADIIVLPSMWDEPAGMTIIESMACKKAVITTISGGIPEYTGQGNCILLERSDNISYDIAEKIEILNKDPDYESRLAENAYSRAKQFNMNYYYNTFVKLLGV